MTKKHYRHLSYEQRCQIYALKKSGESQSSISQQLGVHKSTISRELKRNKGKRGYRYKQAQSYATERRHAASAVARKLTPDLLDLLEEKLCEHQWSPEQISGWLRVEAIGSISHERIYQHIWQEKHQGGKLYKHLRHRGKKYNKRGAKQAGRGLIPGRVDIAKRPAVVEEKTRAGDWELDTIIGTGNSGAIVSMVDRASKCTKLQLVPNKTAPVVTAAIQESLKPLDDVVLTMTADNGKEFAKHKVLTETLNAAVYFATPYHSWERGLNEHTNGLVRQYFPKAKRFDTITAEDVQTVEDLLNSRPRKILGFKTPMEVFDRARVTQSKVALQG